MRHVTASQLRIQAKRHIAAAKMLLRKAAGSPIDQVKELASRSFSSTDELIDAYDKVFEAAKAHSLKTAKANFFPYPDALRLESLSEEAMRRILLQGVAKYNSRVADPVLGPSNPHARGKV